MKRCPACETVYAHGGEFCAVDGSVLVAIRTAARGGTDADGGSSDEQVTLFAGSDIPADSLPTVSVGSDGYEFFDNGASGGQRAATEEDRNLIGRVIAERYRVEEIIGRGGMGVVYKARHLLLERPVAVKLLLTRLLADEKAAQRFYREAQTMARVEHPNAVAIFDFGVLDDGAAYIVMEHIDGETLRSLLGRVKRLGVDDAVAIANQICGAVEAAHRQGVVHRDIKPENIMFKHGDSGALVKVVDFGLAKLGESSPEDGAPILTSAGELFGTPAYMAPEYYESDAIGAAADVYSIGVIVYEMLAGVAPFRGTIKSVVSGHLFKDAPLLGDDDGVPAGVGKAVARALSKSPDERFGSAAEFAAALTAAASPAGDSAALDTIRISREEVASFEPSPNDDGPATDAMSSGDLAVVASAGTPRIRPRVVIAAVAAAVFLGGSLIAGTMFVTPQPVGVPSVPPASGTPGAAAAETVEDGPEVSGRPPVDASEKRSTADDRGATAPRDKSQKSISHMEVAPESAETAPPAKTDEPVATAAAPDRPKAADKQANNTNAAKSTPAKTAKDTKKKKKWWNPASWF